MLGHSLRTELLAQENRALSLLEDAVLEFKEGLFLRAIEHAKIANVILRTLALLGAAAMIDASACDEEYVALEAFQKRVSSKATESHFLWQKTCRLRDDK